MRGHMMDARKVRSTNICSRILVRSLVLLNFFALSFFFSFFNVSFVVLLCFALLVFCFVWDRFSRSWPQVHYVAKDAFELYLLLLLTPMYRVTIPSLLWYMELKSGIHVHLVSPLPTQTYFPTHLYFYNPMWKDKEVTEEVPLKGSQKWWEWPELKFWKIKPNRDIVTNWKRG